jgi:hypothetical protein
MELIVIPPCLRNKTVVFKDGSMYYGDMEILNLSNAWNANKDASTNMWPEELPYLVSHGTSAYLNMRYGIDMGSSPPSHRPPAVLAHRQRHDERTSPRTQRPRRNTFIAQALSREGIEIFDGDESRDSSPVEDSIPGTLESIFEEEEKEKPKPKRKPKRKRKPKSKPRKKPKSREVEEKESFAECRICMDAEKTVLFEPCMHVCCCNQCSRKVKSCPICRSKVSKKRDVHIV